MNQKKALVEKIDRAHFKHRKKVYKKIRKPVIVIDFNGDEIEFESITKLAGYLRLSNHNSVYGFVKKGKLPDGRSVRKKS